MKRLRYIIWRLGTFRIRHVLVVNDAGDARGGWTWGFGDMARTYRAEDRAARATGDDSYTRYRFDDNPHDHEPL